MTPPPRRWRVFCAALRPVTVGGSFCSWSGGWRYADTAEQAARKPCPRCGGPVVVPTR